MSVLNSPTPLIKALFTDLDGTAIPNNPLGMPSPKVIEAITQAQEKIIVSVATGRPWTMCDHILDTLHITHPCIVEGGSQIVDPKTNQVLWEQVLSPESMAKICEVCCDFAFEDDGGKSHAHIDKFPIFTGNKRMMVLLAADEVVARELHAQLNQIPEVSSLFVRSWKAGKWDLHISHIGASKRHALEVLLGMLNLDKANVLGIGDSQNDVPLFEATGFKVAMGNAVDELKDQADYIAPTVGEDGLAHVIDKFILSE